MSNTSFQDIKISKEQARSLVEQYYDMEVAEVKVLAGEVDFNFYLRAKDGVAYTLKIGRPGQEEEALDFQLQVMLHLAAKKLDLDLPRPVAAKDGQYHQRVLNDRFLRLQSWVPGQVVASVKPRDARLLQSWGAATAKVCKGLADFDHPYAHRFYKWNPSEMLATRELASYFSQGEEKELAEYFWQLFADEALPVLKDLRTGVNYHDAHELNLLVAQGQVTGIIDFGDVLFSQTINELAIACAYAIMEMPAPLDAALEVVKGFHQVYALEEKELAILYHMIAARLVISVAHAAYNSHIEPENEYLQISAAPAWDLLKKWRNINPALAHFSFRNTCGWSACPQRKSYEDWMHKHAGYLIAPVDLTNSKVARLDLSVGSLRLGNNSRFANIQSFNQCIDQYLKEEEAQMGIGGYGEVRPFYTTDAYAVLGNNGPQWRTVHLGLDVWAKAGTAVLAPLAGEVWSCHDNAGERDYGPTIILKHEIDGGLCFYTLYGHLSSACLSKLEVGQQVQPGEQIASIGPAPENGNWPPHLHFQIILDMLGNQHDFPGVAFPSVKQVWLNICPDGGLFFGKNWRSTDHEGAGLDHLLEGRKKYLGRGLSTSYQQPLHMVRGFGQYLYDRHARRYLDTVNNVAHVGHEHPKVVTAGQRQMGLLNTNTRYIHEEVLAYAEALLAKFPPELSVVHFVNSGSEANELALRMAKTYTSQQDMLVIEVGYHGNTGACIDVSSYKFDGKGGLGAPASTHILPIPDSYRGIFRHSNAALNYAGYVDQAIDQLEKSGRKIAGFIGETILSCGGQIVPPQGYLQAVYAKVRAAGGLCIADEVQVGFGRVGSHFWGYELHGVVPDIITLGKPIGNGHPMGAVVCTQEVADAFANGMEFFSTFGGNPVSSAIGRTVLEVIDEEGLQEHAFVTGEYLREGLLQLKDQFPIIGDVRGHGFFLGFELVRDQESLEAADSETSYLANRMRTLGFLMSTDGPLHNVIKIKPPMCFNKQNADLLLHYLQLVLGESYLQS